MAKKRICDLQYEEFIAQGFDPMDDADDFQDWLKDHLYIVEFLNTNGNINVVETIAVPNPEMGRHIAGLLYEAGAEEIQTYGF